MRSTSSLFALKDANHWAQGVMDKLVADFMGTTERDPNVPPNAPDH